jgi:hypothetical protein
MKKNFTDLSLDDKLFKKISTYYQTIWRDKWKEGIHDDWLGNFNDADEDLQARERTNMTYLLSKFMYFGNEQLRQLLISLYRDLFKYPIIEGIRRNNNNTLDETFINSEFQKELGVSRFLGVGNPSESGVHMLYYLRQECRLRKEYFINSSDIFSTLKVDEHLADGNTRSFLKSEIKDDAIKRYIFIDDFCGSGSQASQYLKSLVENMKFLNPDVEVNYLMLFGNQAGVEVIRNLNVFNRVEAVFTIDESFRAFSPDSRYFKNVDNEIIEKQFAKETAEKYGANLFDNGLGFNSSQLLLSLYHNTPDNSLPIFWSDRNKWKPIFKRYNKLY